MFSFKPTRVLYTCLLLTFIFATCTGTENAEAAQGGKGFLIDGKTKGLNPGDKITLVELLADGNPKDFDSTKTDKDGRFSLKNKVPNGSFYILRFTGGEIPVYLDSVTRLKIEIDAADNSYKVSGNEYNQQMKDVIDINSEYNKMMTALGKKYPKVPEDDSLRALVYAEAQSIIDGRSKALKDYVQNKPVGPHGIFCAMYMIPSQQEDLSTYIRSDYDFYKRFYERYNKLFNDMSHAVLLYSVIKSVGATAPGSVMEDIKLPDPDGTLISLSELRGKVVLIDFWASWCRPCRMENPNVVKAYKKYHEKGFEIYGVSLDENGQKWKQAIAADNLTWIHVSELKGWRSDVCRRFNVQSIPFSILIDKDGKIVATGLRGEELEAKLAEMLGI